MYFAKISFALLLPLLIVGCTTTPGLKFLKALPKEQLVDANDTGIVNIEVAEGVDIRDDEKEWLAKRIESEIDAQKSNSAGATIEQLYELKVFLTKYEYGVLVPQIRATVFMLTLPNRTKITEFEIFFDASRQIVQKMAGVKGNTFEDAKKEFAENIAAAIINGK
jgi:hypothetical protein